MVDRISRMELAGTSLAVLLLLADASWLVPVAFALIALPWALRLWRHRRLTVRTPLDGLWVLFALTAAMGVWAAYDRSLAWPRVRLILAGLALYYALVNVSPSTYGDLLSSIGRWSLGLCLFAVVIGMYFLTQWDWASEPTKFVAISQLGMWISARIPRISGEYFHANAMGAVLTVVWPINAALVLRSCRPVLRGAEGHLSEASHPSDASYSTLRHPGVLLIVSQGSLVFLTCVLIMTASRGAWLGLGTAVGVWFLSRLGRRGVYSSQIWAAALLAVASLFGVGVLVLMWIGMVRGMDAIGVLDSIRHWAGGVPVGQTVLSRLDLALHGMTLVRDYPLTGSGLSCFGLIHSTYTLLLHVGFLDHAHNLFLDLAIEQGLLGLAAFLAALAMVVISLWRRRSEAEGATWRTAAATSLTALVLHGVLDDGLYPDRLLPLVFVPFGLAMAASRKLSALSPEPGRSSAPPGRSAPETRRRWGITALLLVVNLMLVALLWRGPLLSLFFSNLGAVHQTWAELSVYEWPAWPVQDAVRREVDLSRPVAEYQRALLYDPGNPTANRRLGMIELSLGEYEPSLIHLTRAYASELGSNTTRQLVGEALIVNGHREEGRAMWSRVENAQGQLGNRVEWYYRHIGDEERAAWLEEAASSAPSTSAQAPEPADAVKLIPSPALAAAVVPSPEPTTTALPSPMPETAWTGWVESNTTGPPAGGTAVLRVSVDGLVGLPVTVYTSGGSSITNWTGTNTEHGPYLCEFAHLPADTYVVTPEGLEVSVQVPLRGPGVAVVRFVQHSAYTTMPTAPSDAIIPPQPGSTASEPTPTTESVAVPPAASTTTITPEQGPPIPEPTPTELPLDCCQCTALSTDQGGPFRKPPGYTCAEFCYQGCLERGYGEIVCKTGRVGGYALVCPAGL